MALPKIVAGEDLSGIMPGEFAKALVAALQHEAQTQRMYAIAEIFIQKAIFVEVNKTIDEFQAAIKAHKCG